MGHGRGPHAHRRGDAAHRVHPNVPARILGDFPCSVYESRSGCRPAPIRRRITFSDVPITDIHGVRHGAAAATNGPRRFPEPPIPMLQTLTLLALGAMSPVGDGATWYADYDEAVKVAEAEGKDLLVDFTGSDWCGWCIRLHNEVFQHETFWKAAQEDFVLVALDFPRSEEARAKVPNPGRNNELKTLHGIRGFPTVLLMTPEGDVYGRTGYQRGGAEPYVKHLHELMKDRPERAPRTFELGTTVPAGLALPDLDGKTHSFGDLRGKVVMVHFWSSTCPYEKHADPIMAEMEKRYAASGDVVMIGINSNKTELGDAPGEDADHAKLYRDLRKRMKAVGYGHPMLADHGNRVADMFQAQSTPHCFVLDREGVIRYAGALDDDPRGQKGDDATNYVDDAIAALLKGESVSVPTTKPYGCSIKRVPAERPAKEDGKKGKDDKKKDRAKGLAPQGS